MSSAFKRFQFSDQMLEAIERINFTHPTLVQERVIPKVSKRENVVAQSETGSGKSHSFLLPIVHEIDTDKSHTQSVILAPTRELAKQLYQMTNELLKSFPEISAAAFIGGTDIERDVVKAGKSPHIVIGTPTRIKDLRDKGGLNLHAVESLVIDEADLMIDLGFLEQIDSISSTVSDSCQFLVFSATIPEALRVFLRKYIGETEIIIIDQPRNKASIHYSLVPVKGDDKAGKVLALTKDITPYIGLIFANSKDRADELFEYLNSNGVNVGLFHGGLKPRERTKEIRKIRDLEYVWVVASDLAARGLDIDGASHVINFDIPKDIEFFTHRVGRVGRGEYKGNAITLYTPDEEYLVNALESKGYKFAHEDIRKGELVEIKSRTQRAKRKHQEDNLESQLSHRVKKPKKVKPGYRRKMKYELDTLKKQERLKHSKSKKNKR
ncbi:DEAD/DEAH box helicase [Salinicoccus hispanicus]|uniref:DEAD/DEAH box helicase n=1 Tax=Salinicoccus hispanicus TaxID=157225 RepID=A0A6N8TWU5_9STAP|nr:DEAD/DEAH box helicase [Salinicoccus hispanicus]MXQ50173.1 DEAD/DEAH box helicase [Salinicoccus hispanicus]